MAARGAHRLAGQGRVQAGLAKGMFALGAGHWGGWFVLADGAVSVRGAGRWRLFRLCLSPDVSQITVVI